jgi:hypothetical protein
VFTQPIAEVLGRARRVLLAGCGGGYDVIGAVPLAVELVAAGKEVEFASLSFTRLNQAAGHEAVDGIPHLYRAAAASASVAHYCPEAWLARWLSAWRGREQTVWCFENVGVQPLLRAYRHLVEELRVDAIVLVDGGVDSLLRGDETSLGTPAEDLASLAAVMQLDVPLKLLACVGFGAELRDGIAHAQVLERVAELTAADGVLGIWPLLPSTAAGAAYLDVVQSIAAGQAGHRGSHIHTVIRRSMIGEFGDAGPDVWLSPLATLYWFFSLPVVASTHLLLPHIRDAESLWQIAAIVEAVRYDLAIRPRSTIPL